MDAEGTVPPERDVEWTASGAEAAAKHLARVHRIASDMEEKAMALIAALLRDQRIQNGND